MKRKESFINDKRRVSYLASVYNRITRGKSVLIEGGYGAGKTQFLNLIQPKKLRTVWVESLFNVHETLASILKELNYETSASYRRTPGYLKMICGLDDYFIIITLGIQVVAFSIMNNWMGLTNGPMGIPGIPALTIFGFAFNSKISFFILALVLTLIVWYLLRNITKSPFGRILLALSEDEIFTKSLGKKVYQAKVASFTIGAMFAAIPGVLYAHYISYIDPTSFTVNESIFILSIVIIGGMRNLWGSAIAAAVLVILPEALRFVGMPGSIAANMRQIIYGIALVYMMFRYSKGLVTKEYVGQENK